MDEKLKEIEKKLNEIMKQLEDPDVVKDQERFRKLMKDQSDLIPIVEKYHEYQQAKQDVNDALAILDEETDDEMKEMAKEELSDAKKNVEKCENDIRVLLLPKDADDDKNVIVEIGRAHV